MKPSEALEKHRETIREILSRYPVSNPRIFGSVARGEDTEESDLDILVDVERGALGAVSLTLMDLSRLEIALREAAGVPVHVSLQDGLSSSFLKRVGNRAVAL
ncbi:nucleotidyltransferase family protein [Jiella mangrovi]|uniref:Nucleotidyltransferase domain-containing protein n=1 Tax=Jiella mangrovi TaxID=2821407 RepID=A0ABS4BE38_9HYPH|nr:nucleotidyltransferase domain-containing protein [Jiella mangrovi]MBP0615011.1 nucleotidyltransferase domain-containing protein [Jiella mangrovi]